MKIAIIGSRGLNGFDIGAYIPENVTEIEKNAFDGCDSLTEIVLPRGLKKICDLGGFENSVNVIYNGTKDEWKNVSKVEEWYDDWSPEDGCTISCTDGDFTGDDDE
jgi:hypothetical protein